MRPVFSMQRIKDLPEDDRPREKLIARGAPALTDAELLAIVLRNGDGRTGMSALDQARFLLRRFGGLDHLARASVRELCSVSGIGPAKATELLAIFELASRFSAPTLQPGTPFTSSKQVYEVYHPRLRTETREQFLALLLDAKNRVIREVSISQGSLTASIVHPREVFAPVVRDAAAAVLFIHNHPSGDPSPSREDISITDRLCEVGKIMGVQVLDHVIIGSGSYYSLADEGHIG